MGIVGSGMVPPPVGGTGVTGVTGVVPGGVVKSLLSGGVVGGTWVVGVVLEGVVTPPLMGGFGERGDLGIVPKGAGEANAVDCSHD
jgi:hypothetical protein